MGLCLVRYGVMICRHVPEDNIAAAAAVGQMFSIFTNISTRKSSCFLRTKRPLHDAEDEHRLQCPSFINSIWRGD